MWQFFFVEMSDWNDGYSIELFCGFFICNMMLFQFVRLKVLYKFVCSVDMGLYMDIFGNRMLFNLYMVLNLF